MIYIPLSNMRESAEALEPCDQIQSIKSCRDWILSDDPDLPLDRHVLARYGLVLLNVYRASTAKEPVKQKFFVAHLKGESQWPGWMVRYHKRHRSLLVLLGWTRWFCNNDGATPEEMAELCRKNQSGVMLQSAFESRLKGRPCNRSYSQFAELPGACQLFP